MSALSMALAVRYWVSHVARTRSDFVFAPRHTNRAVLLIVDYDHRTLNALRRSLADWGYGILTARSAPEAMSIVQTSPPHLVLIGSHLPDADGLTLCRHVKASCHTFFLPVILVVPDDSELEDRGLLPDVILQGMPSGDDLAPWIATLLGVKQQVDRRFEQLETQTRTLDALKSDIIDNVSHELGTPLLQVKSAVALLVEDIRRRKEREQSRIGDMATQAVARLEGAINNIRQLARTHNMQFTAVVLHEAADNAIRQLDRSWTSRGAKDRIENHLPAGLPPAYSDKRVLSHILQLLLDNALKFSPDDTPVHITGRALDRSTIWIGVRDFGIGIPPAAHDRIFEPFFQVDGSATRRYGGTGTGLALATLLASGLNTTISLESTPGEGSTFSFLLPVADLDIIY